jgi:myo-inositol-1(or 4)-monophosphatase
MTVDGEREILRRIATALQAACAAVAEFAPDRVTAEYKSRRDPVTEADRRLDRLLREALQRDGEGWLSEESFDDGSRLQFERLWVVDPLDGTAEFVAGLPEWCISVGFVERGSALAGGVCNPSSGELFLGSKRLGVTRNGEVVRATGRLQLDGALVLASRTEYESGRWRKFQGQGFAVRPLGSIAYKLALVAAGKADATWTMVPKHEWDIAAGVALVEASGGFVTLAGGSPPVFNQRDARVAGLIAGGKALRPRLTEIVSAEDCAPGGKTGPQA